MRQSIMSDDSELDADPFFVTNETKSRYKHLWDKMCTDIESWRSPRKENEDIAQKLEDLVLADLNHCTLCSVQQFMDDENRSDEACTHTIDKCYYQAHAGKAREWLKCFEEYKVRSSGPGARCSYCRFPKPLCWRTMHRHMLNNLHGNETEYKERTGSCYPPVECEWVKVFQWFVVACMVGDSEVLGTGVSLTGAVALYYMGWKEWDALDKKGPAALRPWLEEMDGIEDFRCPRLVRLYWLLATMNHDLAMDSESEVELEDCDEMIE